MTFKIQHLKLSTLILVGSLAYFLPLSSFSDSVSTTGVQFLEIPAGVRGAGMGGMFTAVADDVSTMYWNTAGLAQLTNIEINLLHVSYFADTDYEFLGAALPLQPGSTLGLSASFDFVPSFNSTNNPSATPGSANDLAVALGYGQTFGDNFALGIGGKFISSNLVTYSAVGEAMDAGLLFYTKEKDWTLGLSVQNLGQLSNFSDYSSQEKLPLIYRGGLAYRFQSRGPIHFLVGVDLEKPIDNDAVVQTGGEFWWGDKSFAVAVRGGYSFNPLNQDLGSGVGASAGAGLRVSDFELNYALVPFGVLGDTQRFSLTYRFGFTESQTAQQPHAEKSSMVEIKPQIADVETGTLKQATFDIKPQARTDIKNWTLEITDPKGNVIRSYSGKGVPPRQIAWDGKDSNGNIVTGGIFANYNLRTVDARGQQIVASDPIFKVAKVSSGEGPLLASAATGQRAFMAPSIPESVQPMGMSGAIKVPSISFPEKSSNLKGYYSYLDQVARIIRKYPDCRVYIEGHAYDEGTDKDALRISQNRADEVLRYLVEKGKISPDNLYSRGHGASTPLDTSDTEEARGRNRRVDIVIITK
jgi:outer membrane protein OmpA-like peptidoglycan-associated protein